MVTCAPPVEARLHEQADLAEIRSTLVSILMAFRCAAHLSPKGVRLVGTQLVRGSYESQAKYLAMSKVLEAVRRGSEDAI